MYQIDHLTLIEMENYYEHHSPRRHRKRVEEVLPECPYGKCKLIDNEFVELCEICERDENLHYEHMQ